MADIQHVGARKLLPFVYSAATNGEKLTYRKAAKLIGRPTKGHSRAVANMCDLLDAAACLAEVPLLALVTVLTESGKINPKAHRQNTLLRDAIIERSENTSFAVLISLQYLRRLVT